MTNPKIEQDLGSLLNKIDLKIDNLAEETRSGQKEILKEISNLKVGLEQTNGSVKALDIKVDQLEKRVSNVEFAIRGVLVSILIVIFGGFAMFFWMSNKL